MSGSPSPLARLRQPKYTGENRCLPCTILNVAIASVGTTLLVAWLTTVVSQSVALAVGTTVLAGSLAAIWLRGYLVPGTPALTKRYLPESVLAAFGKAPAASPTGVQATSDSAAPDGSSGAGPPGQPDVEALLESADAIEPCRGDDRCLTDDFEAAWRAEIDSVQNAPEVTEWVGTLGLDGGSVTTNDVGTSFVASVDGRRVGSWESEPAFEADLAAASVLADTVPDWESMSARARGQVCNGLRIFLETCPRCGGPVSFDTETVESCCTSRTVAAVTCEECDVRVFESPVEANQRPA